MSQSRRAFLRSASLSLGAVPFLDLKNISTGNTGSFSDRSFDDFDTETDFWRWVRESYTVSSNLINLNNGGVSPQPKVVQEVFEQYNRMCNEGPSFYMWRILDQGRVALRQNLAAFAGVNAEEIALQRNATEALDTIIFGLKLNAGDEVIVTNYDYPNMRNAWKYREKRDGIKLVWINIPLNDPTDDEIVDLFANAITPKTKVVHITHVINWTGQILPAKKIAARAHQHNLEVVLDAAHSFAHLDFNLAETGCDYAGTSLHKWLCAPFGTGMLYVRKEKIAALPPIFPNEDPESDDIKKFETLGTRSFPAEMAVGRALAFHQAIGSTRKMERLKYLQQYWVNKVKDLPRIKFYTPLGKQSCALTTVGIEGMDATEIEKKLHSQYGIHTVPIVWEGVNGVRVTPHVYTSTSDLDKLVEGLRKMAEPAVGGG